MAERRFALWPLLFVCQAWFARSGHASVPHPACQPLATLPSTVYLFSADLDGEDGSDLFVADRSGESTVIIACDLPSLGPWDMRDTNKPLNTVVVVDVEGDGTEELIVGGPTGSSPLVGTITRLKGTQLEPGESVSVRPADEAGYEGPFSIPSFLEKAQKLTVGPHNRCAGPPLAPPKLSEKNLIQLSAQPSQRSSCLRTSSQLHVFAPRGL